MTEKDLRKALLQGDTPSAFDPQALTDRILRRDRIRMTLLGILCIFAWMAVVMLPWATILPMLAKVVQHQVQLSQTPATTPGIANLPIGSSVQPTPDEREESLRIFQIVKTGTLATFFGSLASMFFAAICTVSLILLSRRATLRQLNARLADISAQLKALTPDKK